MEHKLLTPEECCNCKSEDHCPYCDGGLAFCTVCHEVEAGLPTDCPGYPMSFEEGEKVQRGEQDFVSGEGWLLQSTADTRRYRKRKELAAE